MKSTFTTKIDEADTVGLLKISDGYLGPVLYARTRADPKSRLNSYAQNMTAKNDYLIHEIDVAVSDILGMWTECQELFVILNPLLL